MALDDNAFATDRPAELEGQSNDLEARQPVATPPEAVTTQPQPPQAWSDIKQDPTFNELPPEKKLVVFDRWHSDAEKQLSSSDPNWPTMKDQFDANATKVRQELGGAARNANPGGHAFAGPMTADEARYRIADDTLRKDPNATLPPDLQDAHDKGPPEDMTRNGLENAVHYALNTGREAWSTLSQMLNATALAPIAQLQSGLKSGNPGIPSWLGGDAVGGLVKSVQDTLGLGGARDAAVSATQQGIDYLKANMKEKYGTDPNLANSLGAKSADLITRIAAPLAIAALFKNPAAISVALEGSGAAAASELVGLQGARGIAAFMMQHRLQTYGETYAQTSDPSQAENAANRATLGDALFVGQGHVIAEGLGSVLEKVGMSGIPAWAAKVSVLTGGNLATNQIIKAADAASQAPPGERAKAFSDAFKDVTLPDVAVNAAFGVLSAAHTKDVQETAGRVNPLYAAFKKAQAAASAAKMPELADLHGQAADQAVAGAVAEHESGAQLPTREKAVPDAQGYLRYIENGHQIEEGPNGERRILKAPEGGPVNPLARFSDAELDHHIQTAQENADKVKAAGGDEAPWKAIVDKLTAEKEGRAKPAAEAAPEAKPAGMSTEEKARVDQNVDTRAKQIIDTVQNQVAEEGVPGEAGRLARAEELISKLRLRASTGDAETREAYRKAHEFISEQADAAEANPDRATHYNKTATEPALDIYKTTAAKTREEQQPPAAKPAAPTPPQPKRLTREEVASGDRAIRLRQINDQLETDTTLAPEEKDQFRQWIQAQPELGAAQREESAPPEGVKLPEGVRYDGTMTAGSKVLHQFTDTDPNSASYGATYYVNAADLTTDSLAAKAESKKAEFANEAPVEIGAAKRKAAQSKQALAEKEKDARDEIEDKFFGPNGIFYKIQDTHFDPAKPKEYQAAVAKAVVDIEDYVKNNPHLQQYYDQDMTHLRNVMDVNMKRPLTDDEFKIVQFALGATSPNTMLSTNVLYSLKIGEALQRDGDLRAVVAGAKGVKQAEDKIGLLPTHAAMLQMLDKKVKELGSVNAAMDWFQEPVTREELNAVHKEAGYGNVSPATWKAVRQTTEAATGQRELVPRVFAFGTKAGAYTLNHLGDYRFNTTDKWESRFIRSYFPAMFEKATGIPLASEHEMFARFAKDFKTAWEEKYGETDNAGLQALRWYFVLAKVRELGYPYARTSETISKYAEKHYAPESGILGRQRGAGETETGGAGTGATDQEAGAARAGFGAGKRESAGAVNETADATGQPLAPGEISAPARAAGWEPSTGGKETYQRVQSVLEKTFPTLFKGDDALFKLVPAESATGNHIWVHADGSPEIYFDAKNFEKEAAQQVAEGKTPENFAKRALTEEIVHKFTGVDLDEASRLGKELQDTSPALARSVAERYFESWTNAAHKEAAIKEMLETPQGHAQLYYESIYDNALAIAHGENRSDAFKTAPKTFIEHVLTVANKILTRIRGTKDFASLTPEIQKQVRVALDTMERLDKAYEARFGEPSPVHGQLAEIGAAKRDNITHVNFGEEAAAREGKDAGLTTVNIGLHRNEGEPVKVSEALKALTQHKGVEITRQSVHESTTEPTLVANLSRPLTPKEAHKTSEDLGQQSIAQHNANTGGELHGPGAEQWRPFNANYFLLHSGRNMAEDQVYQALDKATTPGQVAGLLHRMAAIREKQPGKIGAILRRAAMKIGESHATPEAQPELEKAMDPNTSPADIAKALRIIAVGREATANFVHAMGETDDAVRWMKTAKALSEAAEAITMPNVKRVDFSRVNAATREEEPLSKASDDYNLQAGRSAVRPANLSKSARAADIADAFELMRHSPEDPSVKASYAAFKQEIKNEWDYATKTLGIKIEPTGGDPYEFTSAKNGVSEGHQAVFDDIKNNHHLFVFKGGNDLLPGHPLAELDPDTGENYNTMFRAIHDIFGHAAGTHPFTENGEESAWARHVQMFPPDAQAAMTAETRGQTSWFFNRKAVREGAGTGEFAPQKAGLLPAFAQEVGAAKREGAPEGEANAEEFGKMLGLTPPGEAATPAKQPAAQTTGGIAARVGEARGVPVEPGTSPGTEDFLVRGRQRVAQGEDADARMDELTAAKGAATPDDIGLFRARLEQLQKESNERGEISPQEIAFEKKYAPFREQWAQAGHAMQGDTDLDTGTLLGLQRGVAQERGRAMKPNEEPVAQKIAKQTQDLRTQQSTAEQKMQEEIVKQSPQSTKIKADRQTLSQLLAQYYPKDENVGAPFRNVTAAVAALPKDLKLAIWKYAKENYMTGTTWLTLEGVEKAVGADLGMPPVHVREIFAEPKSMRTLSDQAYAAQAQQRMMATAARTWIKDLDSDPLKVGALKTWDTLRSVVTLGHANAPITHAGMLLFDPKAWGQMIPAIRSGFKILLSPNGPAAFETMMREVAEHPDYPAWTRAGLQAKVGVEDEVASYMRNGLLGRVGIRGNMAMSVLKWLRMARMEYNMSRLTPAERTDPEIMTRMAGLVNNETGILSANTKLGQIASKLAPITFAGQLEGARWKNIVLNPIEAARLYTKGDGASPSEKIFRSYVTKQTAKRIGMLVTALGVNALANNNFGSGDDDEKINFLDPTKADWLAFKLDGHTVITPSNFLAPLRLTMATVAAPFIKGARNDVGDRLKDYALGKLHPGFTDAKELIEGKQAFTDRPLPWKGDGKKTALSWFEYLASKGPIPIAQTVQETAQALQDEGVDGDTAKIITAASIGLSAGLLGLHAHETGRSKPHEVPWDVFSTEGEGKF